MPAVFGRDAQLDALRRFVDSVSEGRCALTLEGEAGIGKTTLWSLGVEYGRERGFRMLVCRSARSEAELSYAGLADVLAEVPDEALETLPGVQRHALEVALVRAEPGELPVDHRTVAAGALGALRWFASASPVLIALDDPQWMDVASRSTLAYAVRRLDDEPVGVLTAVRTGEGREDPLELELAFPDERLRRIELEPLSAETLGRMLNHRLGWVPDGSALFELHTVSGGNPLFALEIARAMLLDPDHRFLVPRSLHEQVSDRIAALPTGTREALVVAASLPRPTVGMTERTMERDGDALGPAVEAGMVEVQGSVIRFTHPLYASVAYADADPNGRARIHGRLADLVRDPEEHARHLALSVDPPDARVADALEEAAERARSRGAPRAAAELALEAGRFTPEDQAEDGRRRVLLVADALYEVGEMPDVVALLEDVLDGCPKGPERAQVLWRLGRAESWGETAPLDIGESRLEQAEAEVAADPWLGSLIHRYHFWFARQRYRYSVTAEHARPALDLASTSGDPAAEAASLALLAWAAMVAGRGVAEEVIRKAMGSWEAAAPTPSGSAIALEEHPGFLCGEVLRSADRLDEARSVLEAFRQEATDRGSEAALSVALYELFEVELLGGNWDLLLGYVEEASRLQVNTNIARLMKGTIAAHLGHGDDARRDLVRGLEIAERKGVIDALFAFLEKLGFLELSLGNLAEAHRHLSRATALFTEAGILDPGFGRVLPDAIETLVGLGELGEAERHTDWLEERGRSLDRSWAIATGARCRGLLLAAKGDHEAALEHLGRAMVEHDRLPMPFERGRTLLALGTMRRRAKRKREAREALQEALAVFERLGARLWSDKARAELSAIGGRPAATGGLTPTEERVARLAAAGRTNREIAETLYLSVRTVETHLSRTYHKLGVRSRTELAFALDTEPV